mmetsp:Transcript_3580/g.5593  ORF Transcript_3580/g.5593 Transcript_3580/m.5593 type:complete len:187 (-) Transcript_3580:77-637(-)
MHRIHYYGVGNNRHGKEKQEQTHHQQTCYHCGRQFMKRKGVLHRSKRVRCPACHSNFEHSAETAEKSGKNLLSPFKSKTSKTLHYLFASSLKKTNLLPQSAAMNMTADSSLSGMQILESCDGEENNHEMSAGEDPCSDREDPCPFAFTYEVEEVESYQLDHENSTEGLELGLIESCQMEWLLSNVT